MSFTNSKIFHKFVARMNIGVYSYCFSSCLTKKYVKAQCSGDQHYIVQTNMYAEMSRIALQLSAERQEAWGDMKAQVGGGSILGNMYLGLAIFGSLHSGGSGDGGTKPSTADAPDGGDGFPPGLNDPVLLPLGILIGSMTGDAMGMAAFLKYWCGDGSHLILTDEMYNDILSKYVSGNSYIDFGGDYYLEAIFVGDEYESWIGNAFLIRDRDDNIVGFHDTYDFDLATKRDILSTIKTFQVNNISQYNPYYTNYYISYFDF